MSGLSARDDEDGRAIDWWFMYKLPKHIGPKKDTKGNEYLYYDPTENQDLHLSQYGLGVGPDGAFYHTLQQLFADPSSPSTGWILYNDEYPPSMSTYKPDFGESMDPVERKTKLIALWEKDKNASDWPPNVKPNIHASGRKKDLNHPADHGNNGHCKGIIAFDLETDTAFWLSHSTPRIPPLHTPEADRFFYPDYAWEYAQTFICITLDGIETASKIAQLMSTQHEPQVYGCHLPDGVQKDPNNEKWSGVRTLAQGTTPPDYKAHHEKDPSKRRKPADLSFKSKGGKDFRLLAKSGAWYDDFWIDLVGPKLGADLRVETWRRLTKTAVLPGDFDAGGKEEFGAEDTWSRA